MASCLEYVKVVSPRAVGLIVALISTSAPAATMDVKVWGLQCLRILFDKPDLTEAQFLAALETGALGDMVASIEDHQVFMVRIRIARSSFSENLEGHVNHVTRAP